MYTFPIVEKRLYDIKNIEHIHPRKQRIIEKILKIIPTFNVFGSAIRWDCNEKSDIDLLIDKNEINISKEEIFNKLAKSIDSDFDILWLDEIENNLNKYQKENILNGSIRIDAR